MMLHVVPYKPDHILALRVQPAQEWMAAYLTDDTLRALAGPYSHTLMDDGLPLACIGVMPYWKNRALLWSVVSADIGPWRFAAAARMARSFLDALPFRRIEAAVACSFAAGHKLVKALGFALEAERMHAFEVNGGDCALYARVRV